ncbi:uracil phosphoribosyltransferase [Allosphingosinicella deserti]|uniref:Uracil phosphoribosyltransferase n=1 Tax=Allosphingosinicella deserti TaxID=2116704 RepID=A0A2P7QUM4_9SPHN|nr:uracil phosphoribosyltransferase [Sphingomonas deserti]PSJ41675.1 uracil phosphoribosyltransferase [Sphingomonas deserti]
MNGLTIVRHPLVQHKLRLLRDRASSIQLFRTVMRETATLLCYEVTRDLPTVPIRIQTPVAETEAHELAGKKLVFAPILRAGLAMAEGMLDLVPSARIAHVGLYRDPVSLNPVEYYFKAPVDIAARLVIVVDPMLATGHSAIAAIDRLKAAGVADLRFVCLLAARPGAEALRAAHPDVPIWTAALDETLNDHGYIVPGLGDAGDRTYGTR